MSRPEHMEIDVAEAANFAMHASHRALASITSKLREEGR